MAITNKSLVKLALDGDGTFDVLMAAIDGHLTTQYNSSRIKGGEYADVYLGALTQVLGQSVQFLLNRDKTAIELEILELEKQKVQQELLKVQAEVALVNAQIALQEASLPKLEAETLLTQRKADNELITGTVLVATECKLRAEYDVLLEQRIKTVAETGLLNQKKVTESAQTTGTGIDVDSVIGKQKALYAAQAAGFQRDAEQKVAKILAETWSVRRTTDEGTSANSTNKLDDVAVGQAITALLTGVGITPT